MATQDRQRRRPATTPNFEEGERQRDDQKSSTDKQSGDTERAGDGSPQRDSGTDIEWPGGEERGNGRTAAEGRNGALTEREVHNVKPKAPF
jgi:hypothetical protein